MENVGVCVLAVMELGGVLVEVRSQGRRVVREVGKCEGHGSNLPRTLPRFHSPARRARRRYARTMAADLGTLLDSSYLGDLAERSIDDVRAMRAECQEVESGMSRSEEHTSEIQSLMRN